MATLYVPMRKRTNNALRTFSNTTYCQNRSRAQVSVRRSICPLLTFNYLEFYLIKIYWRLVAAGDIAGSICRWVRASAPKPRLTSHLAEQSRAEPNRAELFKSRIIALLASCALDIARPSIKIPTSSRTSTLKPFNQRSGTFIIRY